MAWFNLLTSGSGVRGNASVSTHEALRYFLTKQKFQDNKKKKSRINLSNSLSIKSRLDHL